MGARLTRLRTILSTLCFVPYALGVAPAVAETGDQYLLFNGGNDMFFAGATADMNFAAGQYLGLTPAQLTTTRASTEYEMCNGTLYGPFANNVLAVTPGCGAWFWEARTNLSPNSTSAGAVAGTPGTLPTLWVNSAAGLSQQIVATGVLPSGMTYVDIREFGTTTSQFGNIYFGSGGSASQGGTYTGKFYASLVASPNIANVSVFGLKAADAFAGNNYILTNITLTGTLQRFSFSKTDVYASTASNAVSLYFNMTGASGQTADFTVRVALPQLELNPNIPSSVASAVVASGGTGYLVNDTITGTSTGGTPFVLKVTGVSATAVTTVSVQAAGSYGASSFPASPAAQASTSGVGTGATFTLTPVDNSAQAFATGPILTSGAAVTRAAPSASGPTTVNGSTFSVGSQFTLFGAPNGYASMPALCNAGCAGLAGLLTLPRSPTTYLALTAPIGQNMYQGAPYNAMTKTALSFAPGNYLSSTNGVTGASSPVAGAQSSGFNTLLFGGNCNCVISRATVFGSAAQTQAQINYYTSH